MDPTHLHAANTEMENQNSTSSPTDGGNLPDQALGAVQAKIPRYTTGVDARDINAETMNVYVNSPTPTTSQATRRHPFRFNIPLPNEHFKGREDILKDVSDFFTKVPADTSDFCDRTVVIAGSGGMGKTETAYKVAAKSEKSFPNAAWMNAETEDSLRNSFLGLAKKLGVASKDLKIADMDADLVKEVYQHIDQNDYGNVLFIFDNAIRFKSNGGEFGIFDYMPTDSLTNKRYPYILITTQTPEWGNYTKMLQVDALSEENSLEFFRSSFRVDSLECDDDFKRLHEVTEGYPLVMNLAASNIDYKRRRNDGSVRELQHKINDYIAELAKESGKILNEEMKHWQTKYKKTLSAAWQMTFQRLEEEPNGREALKILQICSFLELPIRSWEVIDILTIRTPCPHKVNPELQLRDLLYLLERFYAARILEVHQDNAHRFECGIGIHRLVQLAVRQQTNCSHVLQGIIGRKVLCRNDSTWDNVVNTSALHDAMKRTDLPQMALASVGILACFGDPIASHIVQTRKPETKAAEAVWRLYKMEAEIKTSNASAVQLLTELVELWKSAEVPGDRQMYFQIAFNILCGELKYNYSIVDGTRVENFSDENSLRGIENLACELISEYASYCECRCGACFYNNRKRHRFHYVSILLRKLITDFVHADVPWSESMRTQLTHAILHCIPVIKQKDDDCGYTWLWYTMSKAVGVSQSRMAELRTSLWDHGLAQKLEHIFQRHENSNNIAYENFALARCMDFCLDGMDSTDQRVQQVMLAFTEMTARVLGQIADVKWIPEHDYTNDIQRYETRLHFMCDVCSVWIILILTSEPSECLLKLLSRCEVLTFLEGDREDSSRLNLVHPDFRRFSKESREDLKPKISRYIQKYSSSEVKRMQTLVAFCRMFLSLEEEDSSSEPECTDETAEASSSDSRRDPKRPIFIRFIEDWGSH